MKDRVSIKRFLAFLLCAAMLVMYMPSPRLAFADVTSGDGASVAEEPAQTPEPEPTPAPAPVVEPQADPTPAPADAEPSGGSDGGEDLDAEVPAEGEEKPSGEVSGDVEGEEVGEQGDTLDGEAVDGEIVDGEVVEDPEAEEYPAFKESKTVDGVTITLEADKGVLPKEADFKAHRVNRDDVFAAVGERLEAEGRVLVDAIAFDVTPVDKDGNDIQPKGSVEVTFSGTGLDGGSVDVFRVSDDAASVTEMGTSVANSNTQVFDTTHFTIYVSGASAADPNGDGTNTPNTTSHRLTLEYGEKVQLISNENVSVYNIWSLNVGQGYVNHTNGFVENINTSSASQSVTIEHTYTKYQQVGFIRIPYPAYEQYYITAKPQTFTAKFMLQDIGQDEFPDTPYAEITDLVNGSTVKPPQMEDEEPYKFYGWYGDEDLGTAPNYTEVHEDRTYYGKYSKDATIHYVKNTSSDANLPQDTVGGIGTKVKLGVASRSGYSFMGWNTASDGSGTSYEGGASVTMPKDGMTLYAQWDQDSAKMVIRLCSNIYPGDDTVYSSITNIYKNSTTTLIKGIPENPGKIFLGWADAYNGAPKYYPEQTIETGNQNIRKLYAIWGNISTDDLTIRTLNAKGETRQYDGKYHTIEGVQEGESTKHPGYIKVGTHTSYIVIIPVEHDVYASISGIKATGKNAGHYSTPVTSRLFIESSFGNLEATTDYIEVKNNMLTITPVKLDITSFSEEKAYDGTALTAGGEVKFTEGTEEKTSTITADGSVPVTLVNGETLNMRTTGSQTDVGQSKNPWELDWGTPEGWGSGKSTALSINYSVPKEIEPTFGTLTVYYDVVFDKNTSDDVTGMPTEGAAYKDVETGAITAAIPDNKPSREHNDFLGWSIDASATEDPYQPGDSVDVTEDMIRDNIVTLYAVWKIKQYTVTFDSQGGSNVPEQTVEDGGKASKPADPTRSGYTFDGWQLNGQPYDFSTPVTESITLTAKWNSQPVTPTPTPEGTTDDDDNAGNAGGGRAAAAAAAVAPAAPADGAADIADEPTPTTEPPATTIDDEPTPTSLTWAVGNLVMAIMTALGAVIALFRKKEDEDDEDESADKKMLAAKIAGALAGVAAPITFFLTENMADVAVAFDKWTPLMAGILAVQVVSAVLNKTASKAADAAEEVAE